MKKVLVTGANGFVGPHLVNQLLERGYEVLAIGGETGNAAPEGVSYLSLDLTDREQAARIDFNGVTGVVHLAGMAAVGPSFDNPSLYVRTNADIQINLFEAALTQGVTPRFVVVSSGSLYSTKAELPLTETSAIDETSPYAVSKLTQESLARYYGNRGFECIVARPFNHFGPGQNPGFIAPDLAQQVVAAEKGEQAELLVGNLDAERDYTDVRDIVNAYILLLEKGRRGEIYNICSGTPRSGNYLLETLLKNSTAAPSVQQDPARMRPSDNPVIYGNHEKLTADTGWQPSISFESTIAGVLEDWRSR